MNKEDFRVRRTKKSIKSAFMALMNEKAYAKISIKELTEKAVVNRNTFYLHYLDKDDLLDKIMSESLQKMVDSMQSNQIDQLSDLTYDVFYQLVHNQFRAVEEDLDFFRLVFEDDSIPYLQSKFANVIKNHMSGGYRFNDLPKLKQAYIEYLSSGIAGLIKFWLKNIDNFSSEDMTSIVIDIYSKDVLDVLRRLEDI